MRSDPEVPGASAGTQTPTVRRLWNLYSRVYDGLLDFWPYQDLLRQVVQRADLEDDQRLLDLGCGTGNITLAMLESAAVSVDAVDLSPAMLSQAAKKVGKQGLGASVRLYESDALAFLRSAPDGAYDRIVAVNVIYAIHQPESLWKEMLRCLKPGGHIVIANPVRAGSRSLIEAHVERAGWRSLINPRLIGVAVTDLAIDAMARAGTFDLAGETPVLSVPVEVGAVVESVSPAYGGVDVLFTARHGQHEVRVENGAPERRASSEQGPKSP